MCRCAFIPFIMAGDPDLETTEKALYALDEAGADVIELGIPYSVSVSPTQSCYGIALAGNIDRLK